MLTKNEKNVLKSLLFSFGEEYSINEIARKNKIAPNGAFKILKKFEKEGILEKKKTANLSLYSINFNNSKAKSILELSLYQDLTEKIKRRLEDLKQLKETSLGAVIFGSYAKEVQNPNDIDILMIISRKHFRKFREMTKKIYPSIPAKVHEVIQTEEDFKANLIKKDKVLIQSLREGIILWGQDKIIQMVNGLK